MSGVNARLAERLPEMLERHGFSVDLQKRTAPAGGDFAVGSGTWRNHACVKAVWDTPARDREGLVSGGPAASTTRAMTIAYRADMDVPGAALSFRVLKGEMVYGVDSVAVIGDCVGLRLYVSEDTGVDA
ncbi:hypothetical protein [Methylopila sp. 73B]|uniref:hypothetical protein n=1 Tax=Methylopila sp. 73B TaxID=1120792 RepID=UPI000377BFDE|nr:hypothetical protein [Methylopila sp. 73B]